MENFQFANFQSINFQLADFQYMTSQCLHACHMAVNVFMHTTWCQMSPYISHSGKCIHPCHMVSNVSMHVTWWSMSPCMSHGVKCLYTYHMVVNVKSSRYNAVMRYASYSLHARLRFSRCMHGFSSARFQSASWVKRRDFVRTF